ncbi:endonuclease V [Sphaerisporangium siamense]|uniref:Endonuclease V n=1 Tax=Sphaerisporangium siamense TaxID=795645 RepID=A0A7W7GFR0_9ACTN|nr:deoxyribonuclease V [Sphaerisporangium siamense]MBB4705326.1 deoxyribonuclease V [Sphaerisporangium siamense]GII86522.1 endonuclease V [Sphaerisporangium siamense]
MRVRRLHDWPATIPEARAVQERLRPLADLTDLGPRDVELVAGLDVAYAADGDHLTAAVAVLRVSTLEVVERVTVSGRVRFPYVPGLFAFRELPSLVDALEKLQTTPDLLLCDGYGVAHPHRFGLACHLGVLADLPTIGVAKTAFIGAYEMPAPSRGAWSPIRDDDETLGRALRTRQNVKPIFVSQGHRMTLDIACHHLLTLTPKYRIPAPLRHADHLSRHGV